MDDGRLWLQLLLQLVLISINAFFAATEMAVVSLNEVKIKKLAEGGDKTSKSLMKLITNPDKFLSTIQVGITLAGFLASAFAADGFSEHLAKWVYDDLGFKFLSYDSVQNVSVIIITIILSFFMLVLGELVPKRVAMRKSDAVAKYSVGVIKGLAVIMKPAVWLLSVTTNGILRIFGIDPHDNSEEVTEEEIRLMVDAGEEKGAIETNEKEMIENVFEFNNITAADVMTHRTEMTAIPIDEDTDNIVSTIIETGYSRFPVYEDDVDNIIGILSTRQFLLNLYSKSPLSIADLLYQPYFVPESVQANVLFRDMQKKKIHIAVVLDEYGGTSGIITMEDLLEEIVGNIYDEFDTETDSDEIRKLDDNLWRVDGSIELEKLAEETGVNLDAEMEEFDTLAGLILSYMSSIPEDGTTFELVTRPFRITVESVVDHRIESTLLEVIQPESEDTDTNSDDSDKKSDE